MVDPTERFSNCVENYVKYRPGYPAEMVEFCRKKFDLSENSIIADIGSGTGISSKLFLELDCKVFGVEPNAEMRGAAESFLSDFPNFVSVNGSATATTIAENSVDLVIAAQAFHWFADDESVNEIGRIRRKNGYVALVWNERQLDSTPFLRDYESFLKHFATDYEKIRHDRFDREAVTGIFGAEMNFKCFANKQIFDFDGLLGRSLSSSYMPAQDDPVFPEMRSTLEDIFLKFAVNGKVEVLYDTNLYFCNFL